ncbi:hypothetical protein LY78DRAFT_66081 [Colletotrichum sublineola]|nr:hypothetical protein LY78DRAFT_66081 [Colletotrichum sublineola]
MLRVENARIRFWILYSLSPPPLFFFSFFSSLFSQGKRLDRPWAIEGKGTNLFLGNGVGRSGLESSRHEAS